MQHFIEKKFPEADGFILPFYSPAKRSVSLGPQLDAAVDMALEGRFKAKLGEILSLTLPVEGRLASVILAGFGEAPIKPRKLYQNMALALRKCKELGLKSVAVALDNMEELCAGILFETVCRVPSLVDYSNTGLKKNPTDNHFDKIFFITQRDGLQAAMNAAVACSQGTVTARLLCNQPASVMTPLSLARDVRAYGAEYGFEVEVLEQPAIEKLGMESFLAVSRGAKNTPPVLIVMRYLNGGSAPRVGYIGKGIVYDSGGYSLKSNDNMKNMFDDMGGAAAVVGAMTAIAGQKLPVNVIGVIAACENKLSYDSYTPGDVIGSMAGKTIEVTNTDAEGRLTLADACTYAIRQENCDVLVDIATLTGSAKTAVGKYTSAVISNDDRLFAALTDAAANSSEKVWRLDADEEMLSCLASGVADIRNAAGAATDGGGCIVAGLFIKEFTEDKPWVHIDMAGVNFRTEPPAFCAKGATGYGAALLFYLARELPEYLMKVQGNEK